MQQIGHLGLSSSFAALYMSECYNLPLELNYFSAGLMLFAAIIGGKLPDYDLLLGKETDTWRERVKYHRQFTHSILLWILLSIGAYSASFSISPLFVFAFFICIGGISHLVGDILTGTVPIFFWANVRKKQFRLGIYNQNLKNVFIYLGEFLGIPLFFGSILLIANIFLTIF